MVIPARGFTIPLADRAEKRIPEIVGQSRTFCIVLQVGLLIAVAGISYFLPIVSCNPTDQACAYV